MQCFPDSLATKLGKKYVVKTFEWFLVVPNRFLFHIEDGEEIVGYCGGAIPKTYGDGSSSGMLQHAFKEAVIGLLKKPWLIFNKEVIKLYPLIWRNIKKKLFGISVPKKSPDIKPFIPYAGLVVIGVEKHYRGTGIFNSLMNQFYQEAINRDVLIGNLSVKKNNLRAIAAYKKMNWQITEEHKQTLVMQKKISKD